MDNNRSSDSIKDTAGLTDDLQDDIKQAEKKAHRGKRIIEILSVEQMLRKDSGHYGVIGMIVGVSSVEHVVVSTEFGCSDCMRRAKRKGGH